MSIKRNELFRWWTVILLIIAVGLTIYMTVYGWRRAAQTQTAATDPRGDFSYFYTAAKAMTQGQDIYAAQPPDKDRRGYIYPPLIAFLYQPLTWLSVPAAARISLMVNVAAIILMLAFSARAMLERFGRDVSWQWVLAVGVTAAILSVDKIKGELQMFQTNALIAMATALGLWLLDRRPVWAGIALGFAMNIKYQAIALLVYLLLRKRWKAAGATVAATAFWAFLPALSVGFVREGQYLVQGFSGVLRLVGVNVGPDVANVEPIESGFSLSITSAAARLIKAEHWHTSPFLLAGIVGVLWLLTIALFYRARKVPVLRWPKDLAQGVPPWRALVGVEWVCVIAGVLAFGPQTNMRHIVITATVNVLGLVVVLESRGKARIAAIAALVIMWMGLNLPFGHRTPDHPYTAVDYWHDIGGVTFCILIAVTMIAWAALKMLKTRGALKTQVAIDNPEAVTG